MDNPFTWTAPEKTTRTLRPGDPGFMIHNGFMLSQRAGFEISKNCPQAYSTIIIQAINSGWLKPIAVIKESEYVWDRLDQ